MNIKDKYNVVAFSGGKDSTAMLLRMIELDMPIDEIIFCDTGVEFPQMYEHIDKVEKYIGRKITRLKAEHSYQYMLFEYTPKALKEQNRKGKSFPSASVRWCTGYFKRDVTRRHLRDKKYQKYIGIAADELKRVRSDVYPLVEWGWTEADCLKYCYDKGFDWGGLYKMFSRVSCWCCPLQRLDALRCLRHNFPDLWATLLDWQSKTWRKFKKDYSVGELEAKFAKEDTMNNKFWADVLDDSAVIVNGHCYHIGDENSKSPFRGFGGKPWVIEFFDGRVVYTTNLWSNGQIPPELGVQDNARFGK